MAHPSRQGAATALALRLDAAIVWDQANDECDTALRALETFRPFDSWHLVIQDDAIPAEGLALAIDRIHEQHPNEVISAYVGTVKPFPRKITWAVDAAGDATLIRMRGPLWGVAVAYPTTLLPPLIERFRRSTNRYYDRRVAALVRTCLYTNPSLVDHDDGPSLLHGTAGRRAHRFTGHSDYDWTRPVFEPGYL